MKASIELKIGISNNKWIKQSSGIIFEKKIIIIYIDVMWEKDKRKKYLIEITINCYQFPLFSMQFFSQS